MSDVAHTAAPWWIRGPRMQDMAPDFAIIADGEIIAEAFGRSAVSKFHPSEANARLMAKAPELLIALRELADAAADTLRSHPETECCAVTRERIAKAQVVIAKAEGRS